MKKVKQKDLLFILISVTFVVALWVTFSILHSSLSSTLSQQIVLDTQPITATFDTKTLQLLKKRTGINPQTSLNISPTPSPTLSQVSPAPAIQSFQLATGSGVASGGGTSK